MPEQRADTKGHREDEAAGKDHRWRIVGKGENEGKWVCHVLTFNEMFPGILDIFKIQRNLCTAKMPLNYDSLTSAVVFVLFYLNITSSFKPQYCNRLA